MTELMHSAKGTTWKKHKYIRKEGKRYIYNAKQGIGKAASNAKKEATRFAGNVADAAEYKTRGVREAISNIPNSIHNYQLDNPDAPRSIGEAIQVGKDKISSYLNERFSNKDQSVTEKGKSIINKYVEAFKKGYDDGYKRTTEKLSKMGYESASNGGFIANFKKGYEDGYKRAMEKRSK